MEKKQTNFMQSSAVFLEQFRERYRVTVKKERSKGDK